MSSKTIGSLNVQMVANAAPMLNAFDAVGRRAGSLASEINGAFGSGASGGGFGSAMTFGMGAGAGLAVVEGIKKAAGFAADFAKQGYEAQVNFNKAAVAIEAMTGGNKTVTKQMMEQSRELAANSPFDPKQITDYAKRLLGAGVAAEQVMPTIKALSDVTAGVGGDFDLVARAYTQTMAKGKLMAEELNGQFADQGMGAKFFADALKMDAQTFLEMVKAGEIGADKLTQAFANMTKEGGKFFDMSKKMADVDPASKLGKTFGETRRLVWSGISDALDIPGLLKGLDQGLQSINRGLGGGQAGGKIAPLIPQQLKPVKVAEVPAEVKMFIEDFKKLKPLKIGDFSDSGFGAYSAIRRNLALGEMAMNLKGKDAGQVGFEEAAFKLGNQFLELEKAMATQHLNQPNLIEAGTQAAAAFIDKFNAEQAQKSKTIEQRVADVLADAKKTEEAQLAELKSIYGELRRRGELKAVGLK